MELVCAWGEIGMCLVERLVCAWWRDWYVLGGEIGMCLGEVYVSINSIYLRKDIEYKVRTPMPHNGGSGGLPPTGERALP